MRKFTKLASSFEKLLLETLSDPETDIPHYRATMHTLGNSLASSILNNINLSTRSTGFNICIACTAEDADYLAKGLFDGFSAAGIESDRLNLVCFWNGRFNTMNSFDDEYDVAPIVKQYKEVSTLANSMLIIVKSIISSACVVKTNLSTLIQESQPERIFVAAPVMYKDAEEKLALAFSETISSSFEYFTFAHDDEKSEDGKNVFPGIGGSVYERLGVANPLAYIPEIVKLRRLALSAQFENYASSNGLNPPKN
jgi:hypothetical protein